jgi:hypothetical protein
LLFSQKMKTHSVRMIMVLDSFVITIGYVTNKV